MSARAHGPCRSLPQNRPSFLWKRSLINFRVMDLMEVGGNRLITLHQHKQIPKNSGGWVGDEPRNGLDSFRISGSIYLGGSCDQPINHFRHNLGRRAEAPS